MITPEEKRLINDAAYRVTKRHGSWAGVVARDAMEDLLETIPRDLCSVLRQTWSHVPREREAAGTIAQAIDLGLGVVKARQVLTALAQRDLSSDKVGD